MAKHSLPPTGTWYVGRREPTVVRHAISLSVAATHVLFIVCLTACGAQKAAVTPSPSSPTAGPRQTRQNPQFGFSWTLPADWEFIPLENLGLDPETMPVGMLAARRRGSALPFTQIVVRDMFLAPGEERGDSPEDLARLEQHGREGLATKGARGLSSRRIEIGGTHGVEVTGLLGEQRYSARLFYRGRREFQFRCLAPSDQGSWPCEPAFASFEVSEVAPPSMEGEIPRVLHLRDVRHGVDFDAPSDEWLGTGPTKAQGGAQRVWTWSDGQHWVDVQTFEMSFLPKPPDESRLAKHLADHARANGSTVTVAMSSLSGLPSIHLVIDRPDGQAHDAFILHRGTTNYVLLIRQKTRDQQLIAVLKKGFRLAEGR